MSVKKPRNSKKRDGHDNKSWFKKGEQVRLRHGHSIRQNPSKTWTTWRDMLNRCYAKSQNSYRYYGGRGISVCERWHVFENFLEDMGQKPAGKTIDRINVDGNYEPGNCRWATYQEQMNNRRINYIEINGEMFNKRDVAKNIGITVAALRFRKLRGWPSKYLGAPRRFKCPTSELVKNETI